MQLFRLRQISLGIGFVGRNISSVSKGAHSASFSTASISKAMTQPYSKYVKTTVDHIIKSDEDKRAYRGLELTNGLKIVLVSDSTADKCAGSLDVQTGHMQDPIELPGLAHFCEHMLFLGTEKYPTENDYQKYLSAHGGTHNAYTSTDHTNYHFDASPDHLAPVLDRFSQFFIAPLFTADGTEREVNAVDSENSGNLKSDMWRLAQLERSLSNPAHDYHKFGTGNKDTLLVRAREQGLDPRAELLKFHKRYYSSNLMALTVIGKESISELEALVVPMFAGVENKSLSPPNWPEHPYDGRQLAHRIDVVPVKDLRSLHLSFPIPDLHEHYRSNPSHYVGHLLGHEGEGSLLSELKRQGWVNSLSAGPRQGARGFAFFSVDVDLSEEGFLHVEEIVRLVFAYVELLRRRGIQEWIHRECEDLSKMQFRFKDKENPASYCMQISTNLHYYPIDEVLFGPFVMSDWRPDLLEMLLSKLRPENVVVVCVAKAFEGKTTEREEWYGTDFRREKLAPSLLERCTKVGSVDEFKLPERNEFIPTDFALRERENAVHFDASGKALPELVMNEAWCRVWFKQDDEFLLPKSCVFLQMTSPFVYVDPMCANLAHMFVTLMCDALTEYVYNAELAGLRYGLENSKYAITLSVRGYNEKLPVFLQRIMEHIVEFKPDPQRFAILKENYVRQLKNFQMDQPYQHAMYYTSLLLSERAWSKEELLQEAENGLTIERLEQFTPFFLSALHFEALVHGNTTRKEAVKLMQTCKEIVDKRVGLKPLFPSQLMRDREIRMPDGCYYVFEATNKVHPNSALEMYLQCGLQDTEQNMLVELLCQILNEPCFDQLRTKEQLGYIVFSGVRRANGTQGVRVIIQSERAPVYVERRIEIFLNSMLPKLKEMPDAEFEEHKTALAVQRLERPKRLSAQAGKYWSEITSQQFNFARDEIEVESLKKITKANIVSFYENAIGFDAPKRKKLTVYVASQAKPPVVKDDDAVDAAALRMPVANKVNDHVGFKSDLPLYPLVKPFVEIPKPAGLPPPKSML